MVHFFDVGRRVKIIGIEKRPMQPSGKNPTHRGFSCSGCAHQKDDHGSEQSDGRSGAAERE
jgi:hypothetical protein